jgi:hypothetical protein
MFDYNPVLVGPVAEKLEEFEVLAKTCAHQARFLLQMASDAQNDAVEMWRMAKEHQRAAGKLNGARFPISGKNRSHQNRLPADNPPK